MFLSKNVIDLESGDYTFSDYFRMNIDPQNLSKVFGYEFNINKIEFKKSDLSADLKEFIDEFDFCLLKERVDFSSETAKREFLISPIVLKLIKNVPIKVKVEVNTYYDRTLKGSIDYVLNNDKNIFIAIEAKNSDMEKGLNQLIAEMIAIDKIVEEKSSFIYGAVTIGFDWSFVVLNREEKAITQNLYNLHIDTQLKDIIQILVGILE
jgi:hypothetical protein